MVEEEEEARQYFEELNDILPTLSPRWWKKDFKYYVDKFIKERLNEKDLVTAMPCRDEEEAEQDRIYIHAIRRLVAGAVQELELVQQPKHATMCAKLDGALVWQGRGYVNPIQHVAYSLQPSLQSQFEKVSPNLWLVMPITFYEFIFLPLVLYSSHKYIAKKYVAL
jgi:hypothetical protein